MGLENDDVDDANEDVDDANDDVDNANDDVDGDETDNQPGLWLVPMLRCHPEHVSLVSCLSQIETALTLYILVANRNNTSMQYNIPNNRDTL